MRKRILSLSFSLALIAKSQCVLATDCAGIYQEILNNIIPIDNTELNKHLNQTHTQDKSYFTANSKNDVIALLNNHCPINNVIDVDQEGNQRTCRVQCTQTIGRLGYNRGPSDRIFFSHINQKVTFKNGMPTGGDYILNLYPD